MIIYTNILILFVLAFTIECNGILRFANYFQDHMVLQRAPQKAIVWGFGDPNTLTTLTINGKTYTTISESQLKNGQNESIWSVTLDPVSDEGPFDIHVTQPTPSGNVTITLNDVLFGDVWLCSGQSNMVLTVNLIYNGSEEIVNAGKYPKIRLFTATSIPSAVALDELQNITQNWSIASPSSLNSSREWVYFSAVCWLYGRMIHQALDNRPIGLMVGAYVGTAIEVWMPPQALKDCNATQDYDRSQQIEKISSNPIPTNYSCLFNGVIHPFTRMVIYGVIWYQGEANGGPFIERYSCSFARMITRWREIWNNRTNGNTDTQFPFGFVQLGTEPNDTTVIGSKSFTRWLQTFRVGYVPNDVVPKVFMAVACDLRDDPHGVHTATKEDVGYRLSRSGLAVAYGKSVEFQGPLVENISYVNGSTILNVTYRAVSSLGELRSYNGFDVCCGGIQCEKYGRWYTSPIIGQNGLTVTISVNSTCIGKQVVGIRYLWRETPCDFKKAPIYSGTDPDLPSPPYFKYFNSSYLN